MAPERSSPSVAGLTLRLKKKPDGAVVTFVRPDGTATTSRLGQGGFGAVHDLTHYAVESTLRLRHGFLGLVADGWNLADFEVKHANRRFPDEASSPTRSSAGRKSRSQISTGWWPGPSRLCVPARPRRCSTLTSFAG